VGIVLVIKMTLVFGLLGGTLWWLRRHDRGVMLLARKDARPVAVLAQTKLSKTASVAVVRIGNDSFAVGVTDQSVTLLLPEPVVLPEAVEPAEDEDTEPRPSFADALRKAAGGALTRGRTVEYLPLDRMTDGTVSLPSARKPGSPTRT
jgi:flagellar biogenesis protein FliO